MNTAEYNKLLQLKRRISSNEATEDEKNEYMRMLYANDNITEAQYNRFIAKQNSDDIMKAGLTIGGVLLAFWLLSKLILKPTATNKDIAREHASHKSMMIKGSSQYGKGKRKHEL